MGVFDDLPDAGSLPGGTASTSVFAELPDEAEVGPPAARRGVFDDLPDEATVTPAGPSSPSVGRRRGVFDDLPDEADLLSAAPVARTPAFDAGQQQSPLALPPNVASVFTTPPELEHLTPQPGEPIPRPTLEDVQALHPNKPDHTVGIGEVIVHAPLQASATLADTAAGVQAMLRPRRMLSLAGPEEGEFISEVFQNPDGTPLQMPPNPALDNERPVNPVLGPGPREQALRAYSRAVRSALPKPGTPAAEAASAAVDETTSMAPPVALSFIPGVGKYASAAYSSAQLAGDTRNQIYDTLRARGYDHDTADKIARQGGSYAGLVGAGTAGLLSKVPGGKTLVGRAIQHLVAGGMYGGTATAGQQAIVSAATGEKLKPGEVAKGAGSAAAINTAIGLIVDLATRGRGRGAPVRQKVTPTEIIEPPPPGHGDVFEGEIVRRDLPGPNNGQRQLPPPPPSGEPPVASARPSAADDLPPAPTSPDAPAVDARRQAEFDRALEYSAEDLADMPAHQLRRVAGTLGVTFDSTSMTVPRVLDAQDRARLESLPPKTLYWLARGLGLKAGSRERNIESILGWRPPERSPADLGVGRPDTPPSPSPRGYTREQLERLSPKEVHEIAVGMGLKPAGKPNDVDGILDAQGTAEPQGQRPARTTFSRAAVQRKLLDYHDELDAGFTADDDAALQQHGGGDPFTFFGQLPGEIRRHVENNPGARRLFKVTDYRPDAGGEDAMHELGDRYWQLADSVAGSRIGQAKETARRSNDPAIQFWNAVDDNLPPARERREQNAVDPHALQAGQEFRIHGHRFQVIEDADGYRLLRDGTDYPETPVDAFDQGERIPVDRGTLTKPREPELPSGDPFADLGEPAERPSVFADLPDESTLPPLPRDTGSQLVQQPSPFADLPDDGTPSPMYFDADAAGLTPQQRGVFGQEVLDRATGRDTGALFHEPTEYAPPARDAADQRFARRFDESSTPAMFEGVDTSARPTATPGPVNAGRVNAHADELIRAARERGTTLSLASARRQAHDALRAANDRVATAAASETPGIGGFAPSQIVARKQLAGEVLAGAKGYGPRLADIFANTPTIGEAMGKARQMRGWAQSKLLRQAVASDLRRLYADVPAALRPGVGSPATSIPDRATLERMSPRAVAELARGNGIPLAAKPQLVDRLTAMRTERNSAASGPGPRYNDLAPEAPDERPTDFQPGDERFNDDVDDAAAGGGISYRPQFAPAHSGDQAGAGRGGSPDRPPLNRRRYFTISVPCRMTGNSNMRLYFDQSKDKFCKIKIIDKCTGAVGRWSECVLVRRSLLLSTDQGSGDRGRGACAAAVIGPSASRSAPVRGLAGGSRWLVELLRCGVVLLAQPCSGVLQEGRGVVAGEDVVAESPGGDGFDEGGAVRTFHYGDVQHFAAGPAVSLPLTLEVANGGAVGALLG